MKACALDDEQDTWDGKGKHHKRMHSHPFYNSEGHPGSRSRLNEIENAIVVSSRLRDPLMKVKYVKFSSFLTSFKSASSLFYRLDCKSLI